jgi:hypothetical protein
MPALVAGIHVFDVQQKKNVDGRAKPGHDQEKYRKRDCVRNDDYKSTTT